MYKASSTVLKKMLAIIIIIIIIPYSYSTKERYISDH